jgi:uncharacterized protein YqjF (DUF2071 family)
MQVTCEDGTIRYYSRRKWPHSTRHFTNIAVQPGESGVLTERDHFFTARYRLYTLIRGRLGCAQIEHEPWPLTRASLLHLDQNLIEAAGLPSPEGAPIVHYSAELHVKIGYARLC